MTEDTFDSLNAEFAELCERYARTMRRDGGSDLLVVRDWAVVIGVQFLGETTGTPQGTTFCTSDSPSYAITGLLDWCRDEYAQINAEDDE